jgi:hypothetical protein
MRNWKPMTEIEPISKMLFKKKKKTKIQHDTPNYGYNLQLQQPFYVESYDAGSSLNYTG